MKIARIPAANERFELVDVEIPEPGLDRSGSRSTPAASATPTR